MTTRQPYLSARLQGFGTTIFTEMTRLAIEHDALNLGQGFPDFDGPESVKEAAIEAIRAGHNQYCRMAGIGPLVEAIAAHQRRFYDLRYDPLSEITVYSGATEAIFAVLQAICEVGDEVVLFEPYYDSYRASVSMAGATPRLVTLRPPDFSYDPAELEAAITPRTRAILLNTPHNPSGKVFGRAELEHIAALCKERGILAITDEVYEHLVYDGEHVPLATLPGMQERTIVISSAGKTFSFTGWKIGWTCAPPAISAALRCAHQFITFCTANPFQHAIAHALGLGDDFYSELVSDYRRRRDRLCAGLARAGFDVLTPAGTYFALTDIRPLGFADDVEFCRALPERVGVAAIPPSVFYEGRHEGRHLVRWAFCKSDPILDGAIERLQRLRPAGDAAR
ncbi:MAG: aminotransferase class I/II-fold pyridoxal phosphate-dependent enzyme [Myxococcales bacterium]|nr:aminotransferase class I/II-fold pyridoxal phosphate-dependent enzyme [Myxococcales bacterium]